MTFKAVALVGGLSQQKQERLLKYAPEIVIATPGRLLALIKSADEESCLANLTGLSCLVIDEADRMVEKGHFEELRQILELVKKLLPAFCIILVQIFIVRVLLHHMNESFRLLRIVILLSQFTRN